MHCKQYVQKSAQFFLSIYSVWNVRKSTHLYTHCLYKHVNTNMCLQYTGTSVAEWLRRLALKLLAPLCCGSGSNPKRRSCQLLTEGCWFNPRSNVFLQLWKLTAIYNQIRLKNWVKHQFTSPHLTSPIHALYVIRVLKVNISYMYMVYTCLRVWYVHVTLSLERLIKFTHLTHHDYFWRSLLQDTNEDRTPTVVSYSEVKLGLQWDCRKIYFQLYLWYM